MRTSFLPTGLAALALLAAAPAAAQSADSLAQALRRHDRRTLTEQLYVHRDRPAYAAGETMWLKLYAVDGTRHHPLTLSKVAYVELLDAQGKPVLQARLALRDAMGQGSMALPTELPTGRYTLRAYTSWMKNAGPAYFYQSAVSIANLWQPQSATPVASAPAAPAADVQFFPEGGQLVQGVPGRLGFKATDAQGRGLPVTGTVADGQGRPVATFQSLKAGMGSFELTPQPGAAYTATLRLPGGQVLKKALPAAAAQGYALQLADDPASPTLTVRVRTQGVAAEPLQLVAHTGQHVAAATTATLTDGQATFAVPRAQLQPGITHLTVFSGRQPVAERLYFRRPGREVAVSAQPTAASFGPRAKAGVQVQAGAPAALSLAVYRLDSLAASEPVADIGAYLLLAADLPGYVEDAGYYLRDSSAVGRQAADNLMLTQGWRRFRWDEVLASTPPSAPAYPPELNGYLLQGRLTQPGGAPAVKIPAYLSLPGHSFWFDNSVSDQDGRVSFEVPNLYGLRKLVLQTNSQRDSTVRVALLSPFVASAGPAVSGLGRLPERWAASLTERHLATQARLAFAEPAPRALPVPGDTSAFFGRPDEFFYLDDYTRFPTIEEVMREYVPAVLVRKRKDGIHFMVIDRPRHINLQENPLTLIDGLPIFNLNQLIRFDPLKIKRLDVIANRYFLGSQLYDGVVSYTTYKGDLGGYPLNPHALIEEYEGMQVPREFYSPRYDSPEQQHSRLPDLRNLLYWNPSLRLTAGQPQTLDFFTGDQPGKYLIVTQGLTPDGRPASTTATFEVKPTL